MMLLRPMLWLLGALQVVLTVAAVLVAAVAWFLMMPLAGIAELKARIKLRL
jgi:hypothetical protein